MLKRVFKFLIFFGVGILLLPMTSLAQSTSFSFGNELGVEVIPTYPKPNQNVSVNLSLYTADLNSADIYWYKDDELVLSGKGQTKYSFKTGMVGEETTITIKITLLGGTTFTKEFTINPAGVDLVWEANSYVPPFYKGRALHSRQGNLKIVAIPDFVKNGTRISPQNLIYNWSNGINVLESKSGYGKNYIYINGSLLGDRESIEVLVTDPVNNLVAQSFVDIVPVDPEIVFYENDPYYGYNFDSAVSGTFSLKSDEVQILAVPYYFTKEPSGLIKYEWRLNGQAVPDLTDSRTAIFRKPEGESGQSSISLNVENLNRILQQADGGLQMQFGD